MSSVEARLKEREEARRATAERRRAERESDRRPEEAAGYFSQQFVAKKTGMSNDVIDSQAELSKLRYMRCVMLNSSHIIGQLLPISSLCSKHHSFQLCFYCSAIEELLCAAEDVPQEQLPTHFDSISTQCHALQKFLSDSTLYLTSYELRTSQQVYR